MGFTEFTHSPISPDIIHTELQRGYRYYRNLTPDLKERFIKRTSAFIANKKFVARKDLEMTDTVRVIVSACAVQVTFGLESFMLDTFEHIIIYPDIYESPVTKQMHKGETNLNGFICLSWKDIVAGIENPTDNYNLGLHEWTHALRFNGFHFQETDYFFDNYINKWVSCSMVEFNKLKEGNESIFRRYGATNIHEFLSVTTEHFFESPDEFKTKAPDFFDQMCILFNQLPTNEGSVKINVRDGLMLEPLSQTGQQTPLFEVKASFFRTVESFGPLLFFLLMPVLFLFVGAFVEQNIIPALIAFLILTGCIIKFNSLYLSIKFYDSGIYLQKGFISKFAKKIYVNYHALVKLVIHKGSYQEFNNSTLFELNYYNGKNFLQQNVRYNSMSFPEKKMIDILEKKHIYIWYPRDKNINLEF